jgi:site-specific recombinase XerD
VTATAEVKRTFDFRGLTVADHFSSSIAGFADWLPYSGRHKSASTIAQYVDSAQRLATWARQQGHESFATLARSDLRAFLSSLHGRGGGPPSEAWKATAWWGVRSLYQYLEDEESTPDIARRIVVSHPASSGRVTHLDGRDVSALIAACRDSRELAVISVCLDTGVRISELASLQVTDVLVDNMSARRLIVRGKGGKVRGVVLGASTAQALRRYLRQRSQSYYAAREELWLGQRGAMGISGLDKLIRTVGANAGLEIHPHLLRHTWSHHFRLSGGQLDDMCYLAGWSGPAMALRYGQSAASERAEQKAMDLSLVDQMRRRS